MNLRSIEKRQQKLLFIHKPLPEVGRDEPTLWQRRTKLAVPAQLAETKGRKRKVFSHKRV